MASQNPVRGGYEEVETLDDAGGAHAVITRRVTHGTFTVSFFRKFEREKGVVERTAFFGTEHLDSLMRMVKTAEKRIKELQSQGQSANRR